MADFSLDELAASIGQRTGNFAKDVANVGANFVCGLYKDYPGAVIRTPGNSFVRGLWDSLCVGRPKGLPAPPAAPFVGGQCPVVYNVYIDAVNANGTVFQSYGDILWGPILAIRTIHTDYFNNRAEVLCHGFWNRPRSAEPIWFGEGNLTAWVDGEARIVRVERRDNQADNCGSLSPQYPSSTIPANRQRAIAPVTYNDGSEVSVTLVYSPIRVDLAPRVTVDGIDIDFDFSGANIGVGTDSANLRNLEDAIKQLQDDVKDIADKLSEPTKPPSSGDYDLTESTEETAEDKDGIEGLQWVQIELTRSPMNAKKQYGRGAQDVVYAGWFQFVVDGFYLPRDPIHFGKCVYNAPDGATGYAFTLYEGYSARVKEFKRKPEEPAPL